MPVHTPRLCIDGRSASELASLDFVCSELISQLVAGVGESQGSSSWFEKSRAVILAHDEQVFAGSLRRYDTKAKVGKGIFRTAWEKNFVKKANISAYHRFRSIERLTQLEGIPTVTTLLPSNPLELLPLNKSKDQFVVPCEKDRYLLEKFFGVSADKIHVVTPTVRRFFQFDHPIPFKTRHRCVVIGTHKEMRRQEKTIAELLIQFPQLEYSAVHLSNHAPLEASTWHSFLSEASVVVYLESRAFDGATLALEALFVGVPTLFSERHNALTELVDIPEFQIEKYLETPLTIAALKQKVPKLRERLFEKGIFEPFSLAEQYSKIYERLN